LSQSGFERERFRPCCKALENQPETPRRNAFLLNAIRKFDLEHFSFWYRVDLLPGSRLPVAERTGSAGLLAGCRVDLPVHAVFYTNRKKL
jgi:hypothetical protein